ncbi:DUF4397 domain-containing protein [Flavobacterium sp. HJSW_4]|uniref:DUF4397 domain-containing protein n=1 Tax=Flavobacterium sp. HJSW_4 TaxID=3344660 RepID=UPI0035F43086
MGKTLKNKFGTWAILTVLILSMSSCDENQVDIFGEAKVKIVNAAPRSKTQQFFFIGGIIAKNLDYSESTNSYITVKSGDKLVAQFRDQQDGNILASSNIDLQNKDRYTIYLAEDNSGRERIYAFKDDLSAPQNGKAKIKFVHLSGSGPGTVSFFSGNQAASLASVGRADQSRYYEVNAGTISIAARPEGSASVIAALNGLQLQEGRIYTLVLASAYDSGYDLLLIRHN